MTTRRTFLKASGTIPVAVACAMREARALILRGGSASSTVGQTFDFYISTTGSDTTGVGSLGNPWAITSLCRHTINAKNTTNRAAMVGKRVGLLPGTYAIYSNLWSKGSVSAGGDGTYDFNYQQPCLALPSGTSTSTRTFLGASDINGRQTIGSNPSSATHFITASPSGVSGGGLPGTYSGGTSTDSMATIGFDCRDTGGYVQIDGLVLSDGTNLIVSFYGGISGGSTQRITDCWVTNCQVCHCGGNEGNNTGAVWHGGGADNGGVQNCVIFDTQIPGGSGQHNCAGIFSENSVNQLYEYNTIYDCNVGIYDKNQNNAGNTYRYNYIEVNGTNPQDCLLDCAGGAAGTTAYVYNNILVIAPLTSNERFFWQGICTNGPGANPTQAMQFYNNTCYALAGGGVQGGLVYQSPGSASVVHYNNIYVSTAPGFYDTVSFNSTAGAISISDYNAYVGGCGDHMGQGTNGAPANTYTLANWRTNFSLDTHSFNQASASGVFTSPGGAQNPAGYQLAVGSSCKGAGNTTGGGGSACDMGAWGGVSPPSRIGSNLS